MFATVLFSRRSNNIIRIWEMTLYDPLSYLFYDKLFGFTVAITRNYLPVYTFFLSHHDDTNISLFPGPQSCVLPLIPETDIF